MADSADIAPKGSKYPTTRSRERDIWGYIGMCRVEVLGFRVLVSIRSPGWGKYMILRYLNP